MQYSKQKYLLLEPIAKKLKLYSLLKKTHAVIAGGAVRAVFAGENISDYDIYFKTESDMILFKELLTSQVGDVVLLFDTDTANTYKIDDIRLQVIKLPDLFCENPQDIINQFDYTVCMGVFDFDTESFILHDNFLYHIARRELCYNINAKYPLASLFRLKKYIKKGYSISGTEIIKLGLCINNLKMNSFLDLKKQLQGIDTLFLAPLTDKLMSPEYAEKPYDFDTFMSLIDECFEEKLDDLF